MYKTLTALVVACSIAGCATAPRNDVVAVISTAPAPTTRAVVAQPQPAVQAQPKAQPAQTPAAPSPSPRDDLARLEPGASYIAAFPEAERRAACVRLDYEEGTREFSRCLEGNFPENPYFGG
jgi:pyruvate/2-oxoglutarate dehydrogenase complex dihydrolipoamide acyltransferase (E2) component